MHWIRECTVATEDEKVELIKTLRKNKKAELKRLGELLPSGGRTVMLNGVLEVPYCPDSGSDFTVIGRSHWEQLRALDPIITVEELSVPVENQTFDSTVVTARLKAKLHVMIHRAVGPVEPMSMATCWWWMSTMVS
ncbi:hypothetical protein PHYSODRAFT_301165 [Phytophthora sojae]|uniref:Peptidase A2 domain-containing protein n=1 Tax=Phytophthora sojae (strain P6497) TaxID=1094619 RepID=G4ZGB5_PHYSP|nr:hypothetical protein PHYSODRAFT_301165 [Phytophthora sojae]EGZ18560.1 hypothetical protein PHYSODRAFT_301165 [Phytophthora sojae]|eukprot:XP_009527618.1 hypothetical protein PHYSODRAFT_301165 [Phytophthora sojae]